MSVDRRLLPSTFGPWFARFTSLTEVQQLAIPAIMEGRDVLICSATASGKTEAFAAPAAEIAIRHGCKSAAVLIIAPTRALTNDLYRRLQAPMGLVEVSLGRYTGEHKEKLGGKLPAVIIATPEALDSLLARRSGALRNCRLVVLDEIHVLDNTPRGDQLRILLHRLEQVTERPAQRVAASATVDQPEQLGARYLQEPKIVLVPGLRKIKGRPFDGKGPAQMAAHLNDLASHGFKKILVFCRSRNQVETLSTKLRDRTRFGSEIFAHHGSLAKNSRERTERLFQQTPAAVCFATLTLEMGIDIGTVDYVLLAGLPGDISSLLQRIGRGGRRGEMTRCGFVCEDLAESYLFKTMFQLGQQGRLCGQPYGFRPAVLVQQAMVMACAETYIRAADLEGSVPPEILSELGQETCSLLLEAMVEAELLERSGSDRYVPSDSSEGLYQRGNLHSNIGDSATMDVVDRMTGDVVGTIQMAEKRKIEIGGRSRTIVKESGGRLLTDASFGAEPARFKSSVSPSTSLAFGRAVVESLGVEPGAIGVIDMAGSKLLLHGLGTVGSLLFLGLMKHGSGRAAVEKNGAYTTMVTGAFADLPPLMPDSVERFLAEHLVKLGTLMNSGPRSSIVPESTQREAVRSMCGLEEIAAFLSNARLQIIENPNANTIAVAKDL